MVQDPAKESASQYQPRLVSEWSAGVTTFDSNAKWSREELSLQSSTHIGDSGAK